jgi:hypothetical protein
MLILLYLQTFHITLLLYPRRPDPHAHGPAEQHHQDREEQGKSNAHQAPRRNVPQPADESPHEPGGLQGMRARKK